MLRSRKRTCRRSKSRCGGTRHSGMLAPMQLAGRGGGSRRVRVSRRGGRHPLYHDGFGAAEGSLNGGVSVWQTVGGSRRSRRSRLGGGGDMMTHVFPGAWYRFPDGLNRMRGGGSRGREFPNEIKLLSKGGSLRGGGFPDRMYPFSKGGGGIGPWAHEHGTIGFSKGGSRRVELWAHEHGTGLGDAGMLFGGGVGGRGREFPDQMFLAPNGGGRGRDMMKLASSGGSRGREFPDQITPASSGGSRWRGFGC